MSPSFSVKNGIRYPFYVSQAVLKGRKAQAGSVPRVSASRIEAEVLKAIGSVVSNPNNDQEIVAGFREAVEWVIITSEGFEIIWQSDTSPLKVEHHWNQTEPRERVDWQTRQDPQQQTLVKSIARAHHWVALLLSDKVATIEHLAKHESTHAKVIRNRIRLAFLPPQLCSALLNATGTGVTLEGFTSEIPLSWRETPKVK